MSVGMEMSRKPCPKSKVKGTPTVAWVGESSGCADSAAENRIRKKSTRRADLGEWARILLLYHVGRASTGFSGSRRLSVSAVRGVPVSVATLPAPELAGE